MTGGKVSVRVGSAPAPDVVLAGRPQLISALLTGAEVTPLGLEISGDVTVLDRVLPGPGSRLSEHAFPDASGANK